MKIGDYVMCRTYSAGVFAGTLAKREGREVTLTDAKRIHWWEGAASLSELAQRGTSKPEMCRIPMPVTEVLLLEAIEIIPITDQAKASLDGVPLWTR